MQANDNLKNHQPIEVVALALQRTADGRFLLARRGPSEKGAGEWEFPGGKIEKNEFGLTETQTYALKREIKEELNIEIDVINKLSNSVFDYGTFKINLIPFIANYISGEIRLTEHKDYRILNKSELSFLDWAQADIPIVEEFLKLEL